MSPSVKAKRRSLAHDAAWIVVGNLVIALGYAQCLVPNQIISGGVTSMSMVLQRLVGWSVVWWSNVITASCLVLALLFLGRGNFVRSLISSVSYIGLFSLVSWLPTPLSGQPVVALLVGSGLIAVGYYLCLANDASTAGLDVLALITHRYQPRFPVAIALRVLNLVVLAVSAFVYGWVSLVFGGLFTLLYSELLNRLLQHRSRVK